ncbi:MAG TPA: M15 family metallopeptidase [Gemmatimonadaceae bacterium]
MLVALGALGALTAACACQQVITPSGAPAAPSLLPGPRPASFRREWLGLIGEYDTRAGMRLVLEDSARLWLADTSGHETALRDVADDEFSIDAAAAERLVAVRMDRIRFSRDETGRAIDATLGAERLARRQIEPRPGTNQLRVTPVRPVEELRAEALAATPPAEQGHFRAPELVELTRLDPTIKLEIRYATTNNFLGARFYDDARAFMQRPAAEAVVRANQALRPLGYGLLIHDAYRPWYVTKMFWDATPTEKRWLVANPAHGSLHNRGAAVDLTLFDVKTGQPVDMPSTYDESTDRAFANYPGGTALQRWHRALLRRAMEAQGFAVNPTEWWHFDYYRWRDYAIGNVPFDRVPGAR